MVNETKERAKKLNKKIRKIMRKYLKDGKATMTSIDDFEFQKGYKLSPHKKHFYDLTQEIEAFHNDCPMGYIPPKELFILCINT